MRRALGYAIAAALFAYAAYAVRSRPAPQSGDEGYEDYSTDLYTLQLMGPEGTIEVDTRLPFFGTEWGQFKPEEDE